MISFILLKIFGLKKRKEIYTFHSFKYLDIQSLHSMLRSYFSCKSIFTTDKEIYGESFGCDVTVIKTITESIWKFTDLDSKEESRYTRWKLTLFLRVKSNNDEESFGTWLSQTNLIFQNDPRKVLQLREKFSKYFFSMFHPFPLFGLLCEYTSRFRNKFYHQITPFYRAFVLRLDSTYKDINTYVLGR